MAATSGSLGSPPAQNAKPARSTISRTAGGPTTSTSSPRARAARRSGTRGSKCPDPPSEQAPRTRDRRSPPTRPAYARGGQRRAKAARRTQPRRASLQRADDPRGHAGDERALGDVPRDDGAGGHHRVVADRDALQDRRAGGDPRAAADVYRSGRDLRAPERRVERMPGTDQLDV